MSRATRFPRLASSSSGGAANSQYFEFDHVNQYADKNGVWVWNEAPLDEFKADICPPDGMQLRMQPLIAREEEYVFRTPAALVVSGKVIDAVTKKPIKKFRVVPGVRSSEDADELGPGTRALSPPTASTESAGRAAISPI